jgi:antitoxin HicB
MLNEMLYAYPVEFREDENGTVIAVVPDVPGTMTVGASREEALERVHGALIAMLSARIDDDESIPRPSRPRRGQRVATLSSMAAAKLSIWQTMRANHKTPEDLREKLGWDEARVRRVLDLRRRTRFEDIEAALKALGKRLVIALEKAA